MVFIKLLHSLLNYSISKITYILRSLEAASYCRFPEEKLANKVQRACKELASHDQIIPDKEG